MPSSFLPSRLISCPLICHREDKREAAFCLLISDKQFEIPALKFFIEIDRPLGWDLLPLGASVSTRREDAEDSNSCHKSA